MNMTMKHTVCVGICLFLFGINTVWAQLSGNYTVNSSAAASASNYLTLTAAVADLTGGTRPDGGPTQGPGLSGAVTLAIASGTYTEQVSIGSITGTSGTNRVTITSAAGDSTAVVYRHATGSGSNFEVQLNGCSFVTLRHLTLERTGTNTASRVIDFLGTTDAIIIENNRLINGYAGTNTLSYVVNDGVSTSINVNTIIRNNVISGGARGISILGIAACCSTHGTGTVISGNEVSGFADVGIWLQYHNAPQVVSNRVSTSFVSANTIGIQVDQCINSTRVERNFVLGVARFGIYVNICSAVTGARGTVANNYVNSGSATTSRYGIHINSADFFQVVYNTVNHSTCTAGTLNSSSAALYFAGGGNHVAYNNLLVSSCGGYAISTNSTTNVTACDHNCLLSSGTNIGYYSAVRTDLAAWQGATPYDDNSLSEDPSFTSSTNYPYTNNNLRGAGLAVPTISTNDIVGTARPASNPDIGCQQQVVVAADAGVAAWVTPAFPRCSGLQTLEVSIRNFGTAALTSATIGWSVDGAVQTPFSWTGTLAPATTSGPIAIGSFTFADLQRYNIRFWTYTPNGVADGNPANDTLKAPGSTFALAGTYTVGPTGQFSSFNDAVDSLVAKGICADVVLEVQTGTYTEQVSIPEIGGAGTPDGPGKNSSSTHNRVTFTSQTGDSTDVVLTFGAATFADNYVLQLDGADYITVRSITIRSTDPFDNQAVRLRSTATQNILENNRIETIAGANGDDVVVSNTPSESVNTIRHNHILHGRAGIHFSGGSLAVHNRRLTIFGNTLENYRYGIYIEFVDFTSIVANRIFNAASFNAPATQGIYLFGCDSALVIGANVIRKTEGTNNTGIDILNCMGGLTGPCGQNAGNIYNNQILVGGTGTSEVVYMNASQNHSFFFNAIHTTGTNSTSARAFYLNGPFSVTPSLNANIVLRNNIFSATVGRAIYNSVGGVITSNHNVYWVDAGTDIGHWDGSAGADLAALQAANGMDGNSLQLDPMYVSATDITATNTNLEGAGAVVACVNTDLAGNPRPSPPSIGPTEMAVVLASQGALSATLQAGGLVQLSWPALPNAPTLLLRGTSARQLQPTTHRPLTQGTLWTALDTLRSPGVYYYRALHQAPDGKQLLTNVASVAYTPTGHLLILPNPAPAHSHISLQLSLAQAGQAQLRVYNALGQLQAQQQWTALPAGSHTLALPAALAAGVYVVEMVLDSQRLTQKLVVR